MKNIFYVYEIYNKVVDKYYVGSRTISKSIDILNGYNTSSKIVKQLIEEHGLESFEIIRTKTFETNKDAIEYENTYLQSIPKEKRGQYLNVNFSAGGAVIKSQTHNRIYNPETDQYIYHPKDLDIPEGWVKKTRSIPPSRKGFKKHINLITNEIIMIKEEDNDNKDVILYKDFLNNNKKKLNKWITNGEENKRIADDDHIPEGWKIGKTVDFTKYSITNGVESKYITKGSEIPEGWYRGSHHDRSRTKGMIRITNGVETTTIDKDQEIPKGWWQGTVTSGKYIYIYDGVTYYRKKDLINYLGIKDWKFDDNVKKNIYKNKLIIKEK